MSWVRLDDQFPNHAKIMAVGSDAFRLHVTAMCWSATQLTDGAVPVVATRQLGWFCADLKQAISELETAGLWDATQGGWMIHDYLDYNPSREQVTKERAEAKERMRNKRGSSVEVRPNIERTSENVQVPPSPSPSPSPTQTQEEGDKEFSAAVRAWENMGLLVNPTIKIEIGEAVDYWRSKGHPEFVADAINIATKANVRRWDYVQGILRRCEANGTAPGTENKTNGKSSPKAPDKTAAAAKTYEELRAAYVPKGWEDIIEH